METHLETDRLILRRFTVADVDDLVALDGDPEVMRFLNGGVATPRERFRDELLPRWIREYGRFDGFGRWAVLEKGSEDFAGWFGFHRTDTAEPVEAFLGYRFRRALWGRGYATEGARALIRKGFIELGVERVSATTYEDNLASRRVMERVGMTLVRRYRMTPEELLAETDHTVSADGLWDGDDVEYALERADWERQTR